MSRILSFRSVFFLLSVSLISLPSTHAELSALEHQSFIESVQIRIDKQGLQWTAGPTSVSNLSPKEFQVYLGAADIEVPDTAPRWKAEMLSVPATFDWRNNGGNWVTPIRNQANCGACASFASIACLESAVRLARNDANYEIDLSEQHVFSCGTLMSNQQSGWQYNFGCQGGWFLGGLGLSAVGAFDYLKDYGAPDEACNPYIAVDNNCNSSCGDWTNRAIRVLDWSYVNQSDYNRDQVKNAIYQTGPVATRMVVYSDFQTYSGGIYQYSGQGQNLGGHFVLIVGWNDSQSCFIVKNSWGTSWGENGFFRIAYNQCGPSSTVMFGQYTVQATASGDIPTPVPTATPGTPGDAVELQMNGPRVTGEIVDIWNDIDWYRFTTTATGSFTIETELLTMEDTILALCGPDNPQTLITWDDDSGAGYASKIVWYLPAGHTYYACVYAHTQFYPSGPGTYQIWVTGPTGIVNTPTPLPNTPTYTPVPTPSNTPPATNTPITPVPTNTPNPNIAPYPGSDLNGDGIVDSRDLLLFMECWGKIVPLGQELNPASQ